MAQRYELLFIIQRFLRVFHYDFVFLRMSHCLIFSFELVIYIQKYCRKIQEGMNKNYS